MKFLTVLLCCVCCFGTKNLLSQKKEYILKNFTQEEGLPSNETYYVFEDSKHYIWVATDLGVARYNGDKFEVFNLPDNVIFKIKEDSKGRIWFFTRKCQLAYFENEKIVHFRHNDKIAQLKNVAFINITDVYLDREDNFHINSSNLYNYVIHQNGTIRETYFNNEVDGFEKANYSFIFTEKRQPFIARKLWNALSKGISIELENNKEIFIEGISSSSPHFGVMSIDSNNYVAFFSQHLVKFNTNGAFSVKKMPSDVLCVQYYNNQIWVGLRKLGVKVLNTNLADTFVIEQLNGKSVSCITHDFENNLWFSTLENGLYSIRNVHYKEIVLPNDATKKILKLLNNNNENIVFASNSGLFMLNNNQFQIVYKKELLDVKILYSNKKENLFFNFSGLKRDEEYLHKSSHQFKNVYVVPSSNEVGIINDDSLIVAINNYYHFFDINKTFTAAYSTKELDKVYAFKKPLNPPGNFFVDTKSNIWLIANNGLYKLFRESNVLYKTNPTNKLLDNGLYCLRQMDIGYLAAGIRFNGLAILQDSAVLLNITEKEGLLSNKIKYILPYKNQLWLATTQGISVVEFTNLPLLQYRIINFSKNIGLFNPTINDLCFFNDDLLIATNNGLFTIEKPQALLHQANSKIYFHLKSISSFQGDTSGISFINLPFSKSRLVLHFNAISFNDFQDIKYAYRFNNDTIWQETNIPDILLENLSDGEYNLEIKAFMPKQKRTSESIFFTVNVSAPWWKNKWLLFALLLLFTGSIYTIYKRRIKKIQEKELEKTNIALRIMELEQAALKSQMNPHFIFNCLTSIQQLIVSGNNLDANEYLVKFSRLIRNTLELSNKSFISIDKEIAYLKEYIQMEELRLEEELVYTFEIDDNINQLLTEIPNMMLQPLIENSIRHGLKGANREKATLYIGIFKFENIIQCIIEDNGKGRAVNMQHNNLDRHKSFGTSIINNRLNNFSLSDRKNYLFKIQDLKGTDNLASGTRVTIQLPFKIKAHDNSHSY